VRLRPSTFEKSGEGSVRKFLGPQKSEVPPLFLYPLGKSDKDHLGKVFVEACRL
jgi:hypothetical protein